MPALWQEAFNVMVYTVLYICMDLPSHMVDHWCKVSWAIELHSLEALVIRFKDSFYSTTVRIVTVAILKTEKWGHN